MTVQAETLEETRDPWTARYAVAIGGKAYGPYTAHQMRAYIDEGRITAASVVSCEGGPWTSAGSDPLFAAIFSSRGQALGAREQRAAAPSPARPSAARDPAGASDAGARADESSELAHSNFVIAFQLKSRGDNKLEEAIMKLGPAAKISTGVWVLNAPYTAGSLRNLLVEHFSKSDSLFVVDATSGKTAWLNLGPEVDARIRRVWKRS